MLQPNGQNRRVNIQVENVIVWTIVEVNVINKMYVKDILCLKLKCRWVPNHNIWY